MSKTVEQVLQTMVAEIDSKWVSKLSFVEFTINSSVNAATMKIPFELIYGQQVCNVINQLDELYRVEGLVVRLNRLSRLSSLSRM